MRATRIAILGFACLLATARWSAAATEAELIIIAEALLGEYQALETDIDNCPDGTCQEALALMSELHALGLDLAELHEAREELLEPSYPQLDALIRQVDALDHALNLTVNEWEGES